jgi:hypothetical protein
MHRHVVRSVALMLALSLVPAGCSTTSSSSGDCAEALQLDTDCSRLRQMQTRCLDTHDEQRVLQSSAMLLQDLGFELDDSETEVGLLVASKERTAVEAGQVAGAAVGTVVLAVLGALSGTNPGSVPYDEKQHMRVCLVTQPTSDGVQVRITFQRIVWNNKGGISKREPLQESEQYTEFFHLLEEAVFLEAHEQ